jgi:hypothetical protein
MKAVIADDDVHPDLLGMQESLPPGRVIRGVGGLNLNSNAQVNP